MTHLEETIPKTSFQSNSVPSRMGDIGKGHHEAQTRRPPAPRQRLWHHQVTPLPSPLPAHPSLHPPHLSCSRDVRAGGDSGPTSRPPRVGPGSRSEHVTWAATRCPWPPPIRKGHRTLGPLRFPRDSEPCGFSSQFRQWKQSQSHRSAASGFWNQDLGGVQVKCKPTVFLGQELPLQQQFQTGFL